MYRYLIVHQRYQWLFGARLSFVLYGQKSVDDVQATIVLVDEGIFQVLRIFHSLKYHLLNNVNGEFPNVSLCSHKVKVEYRCYQDILQSENYYKATHHFLVVMQVNDQEDCLNMW